MFGRWYCHRVTTQLQLVTIIIIIIIIIVSVFKLLNESIQNIRSTKREIAQAMSRSRTPALKPIEHSRTIISPS